jgi:hypothetical protein
MRFVPLALICAPLLVACGSEQAAAPGGLANLVVRVDEDGAKGPETARELKLQCEASSDSGACRAASGVTDADLAPTPGGQACTQLYGGPQTASISGTLRGEHVDARFSRRNGCEIARWEHVQPLLGEVR